MWCAIGAGFTTLFDSASISYVAPAATSALAAPTSGLQWFLASYSLTFGLGLVPGGRLGDAWGRRPFFLLGLVVFLGGGLVTALAPNALVLVSARFLQGFGAGVLSAQVMGLIQDHFTGSARTRVFAAYTAAGAAAALVGPLLAATCLSVSEDHGWRVVLLIPWFSGALTLALAVRGLPAATVRRRVSLDLPAVVLLGAIVVLALLPVLDIGLGRLATAVVLLFGLGLSVVLVRWERHYWRRGRLPLFAPTLMRSRRFLLGNAAALLWFGANLGVVTAIVMYLLAGTELSPFLVALTAVSAAVGRLLGARLSTAAHARFGAGVLVVSLGFHCLVDVAVLAATFFGSDLVFLQVLCGLMFVHGVNSGITEPVVRAETLERVETALRGVAASFLQLTQRMSASILTAVTAGLVFAGGMVPSPGALRSALLVCVVVSLGAVVSSVALVRIIRSEPAGEAAAGASFHPESIRGLAVSERGWAHPDPARTYRIHPDRTHTYPPKASPPHGQSPQSADL